ncbi:MAG TPA: hypothetical protein DEF82_01190 [Crocinitomicaceae bacterium]|nr:hypothetical protein [Flavobacteriales bacterium]HBW85392.1 hypothetical protein [Crocinitomicaceae bacterium]
MKNYFLTLVIYPLLFATISSCNNNKKEEKNTNNTNSQENINALTEDKIAYSGSGKTFKNGFYHLQFKDDHTLLVYQSSGGATRGCTAEGIWKIENSILNIKIKVSYCGSNDYSELNGNYTYSARRKETNNKIVETIQGPSKSFYHD